MSGFTIPPQYPNFTTGSIPFAGADGLPAQDNTNIFFDNTNKRLGVTTNTPIYAFDTGNSAGKINDIRLGAVSTNTIDCQSGAQLTLGSSWVGIGTANGFLRINGYQSNAVGIRGIGTTFQARLGDDSDYSNFACKKIGVDVSLPTNDLSLGGNAAKTIALERHTAANTAGSSLTIQSGSATSAATDKNGGQLILKGGLATGTGSSGVAIQGCVAGSTGTADNSFSTMIQVSGNKIGLFGVTPVVQPTALTTQLTTITHTAPGTPDYAIQNLTMTTPFGFSSQDEGNTVLSVIANLQTRLGEVETKLKALGALT